MRIFDETKTYELDKNILDFEKGYLENDKRFLIHHEAAPFVKGKTAQEIAAELELQEAIIEKGYDHMLYRVVKEYESGGRDTELIEDEPDIEAKEAYDEYEDIQVYVPYTEAELAQREIAQLKQKLFDTDYQAIKYAEGELSEYEYAPTKAQRSEWRKRINELEKLTKTE